MSAHKSFILRLAERAQTNLSSFQVCQSEIKLFGRICFADLIDRKLPLSVQLNHVGDQLYMQLAYESAYRYVFNSKSNLLRIGVAFNDAYYTLA